MIRGVDVQFKGIIIKGYSGFYYVWEENQNSQKVWECSLRGKFRLQTQTFLPGDHVVCTKINTEKCTAVLEKVLPRSTELIRPQIANIEQVIIITSFAEPEPDLALLDRILVQAALQKIKPILCFNKSDLVGEISQKELLATYTPTNYPLIVSSVPENKGISVLKNWLHNKISVLAGPSGVGKTSILNALETHLSLPVGAVSRKSGRGRHTTRHVELLPLSGGGFLADTPGFSRLKLPANLTRESLSLFYPDFQPFQAFCQFKTCLHREEPHCGVREAVQTGQLNQGRYERYLQILNEVIEAERSY